jgi:hypothetical protein
MKMWNKPQVTDLSVRYTEQGGLGGSSDGVVYQVKAFFLLGTSGPAIDDDRFVRQ